MMLRLLSLAALASAFAPPRRAATGRHGSLLNSIRVSNLSPQVAMEKGVRDWPFTTRGPGVFEEMVEAGTVRYVLEGEATVEYSVFAGGNSADAPLAVSPGSLVEVDKECNLRWTAAQDLVVLTPTFEQGGLYFAGLAAVVVVFGALVVFATTSPGL
ncbi:hypothetical protein M885DRAFT_515190 [Pelagophyceae sp. CCMP2097]|nr:hypothetical protein M885DRAFT_515190 [Pelagophyceae sp. CCMP2097]|mmetsp:Transcript_15482/g.52898  ORF Transcript_15482/g.52898 Transcript_15482/m.52898 type:complete len:157 (+) Transcript_15482:3-473(+)